MSSLDCLDLCRLCLVKDSVSVPIFGGEGDARQIFLKIAACLPVKVARDDKLPKKICDQCVCKIELCYEFWNTTVNSEKQLIEWLGGSGVEDKQNYVSDVLNPNIMKQEQSNENRLDGTVMQVSGHQSNMAIGMMGNLALNMPIIISTSSQQQISSVPMDTSCNSVQAAQPLPGPSSQTSHSQNQVNSVGQEEEESTEEDDNTDDDGDAEEGLPVKEESEEDVNTNRSIEPTTFVNVSLACDEAGPSGLQQQKISEMPEMTISQTTDGDPKSGIILNDPLDIDVKPDLNQEKLEFPLRIEEDNPTLTAMKLLQAAKVALINPSKVPSNLLGKKIKVLKKTLPPTGKMKLRVIPTAKLIAGPKLTVKPPISIVNQPQTFLALTDIPVSKQSTKSDHTVNQLKENTLEKDVQMISEKSHKHVEAPTILTKNIQKSENICNENVPKDLTETSSLQIFSSVTMPILIPASREILNLESCSADNKTMTNSKTDEITSSLNPNLIKNDILSKKRRNSLRREREIKTEHTRKSKRLANKISNPKNGRRPIKEKLENSLEESEITKNRSIELLVEKENVEKPKVFVIPNIKLQEEEKIEESKFFRAEVVETTLLKYECDICKKRFSNKKYLLKHIKSHFYNCGSCDFWTEEKKTLVKHEEIHSSPYNCSKCNYQSNTRSCLFNHDRKRHKSDYPFHCDSCPKVFKLHENLIAHIEMAHLTRPKLCDVCGFVSKNIKEMNRHYKIKHQKPFSVCEVCNKPQYTQRGAEKHKEWHRTKEDIICNVCGRNFKIRFNLLQHMRTHTGDKPFICKICGIGFAKRSTLRQHLLTHTGKKAYECDICGKTFTQKPGLCGHRKSHREAKSHPTPLIFIDSLIQDLDADMVGKKPGPV